MDIKFDDEALRALLTQSIMGVLTTERREAIIAAAVRNLLEDKEDGHRGYRSKSESPTKFQTIFNGAVYDVARQIAQEQLASDTVVRQQIKEIFELAWRKVVISEELVNQVARAFERGLIRGD